MTISETTQICKICNENKGLEEFHIHKACKLGRRYECKACVSKRQKQYSLNNPNKIRERYLRFKRNHPDRIREQHRASYTKWAKNNPGVVNARNNLRYSRKLNATPKWANEESIKQIYIKCAEITKETGIKHNVDHIIPLQGELVSGLHVENNLRIISAIENAKKHNTLIEDLLLE